MFELPEDDVPPEHLWHHRERLDEWFAAVKQRREDRAKGLESVPEADEEREMLSNDISRDVRR